MRTLIQRIGLESNRADELAANLADLAKTYENLLVCCQHVFKKGSTGVFQINVYESKLTDGSIVYDADILA